jgi:programmed cell death protein 5
MDQLQPVSNVDPQDLPAGFTMQNPHGPTAATPDQPSPLEQLMEPEALARLRRIQLVKPEKAKRVEQAILQLARSSQLPGRITDGKLVELLERSVVTEHRAAAANGARSISIQRKKYSGMDSDDDDNDDDLL